MNKIININLAGQAIAIDEKAYETLKKYLHTLERHFSNTSSANEILEDIEGRIAEMFQIKMKNGHSFINQAEVDEAIEMMGNPSDLGIEEEEMNQEYQENRTYQHTSKKLFRDSEDKMLGGVCSGVAAYFDLDVSAVRIATVVLAFIGGFSILPYFILWIILPETKTANDRYRMRGERPDIDNIAKKIRNEAENVAENLKKNETLNRVSNNLLNLFQVLVTKFGKLFSALVLVALVVITVSVVSSFVLSIIGQTTVMINGAFVDFPHIFDSLLLSRLFYISLLALILIPIGALIFLLISFIFNISMQRFNVKALFATWLMVLAFFVGVTIFGGLQSGFEDWEDFRIEIYEGERV